MIRRVATLALAAIAAGCSGEIGAGSADLGVTGAKPADLGVVSGLDLCQCPFPPDDLGAPVDDGDVPFGTLDFATPPDLASVDVAILVRPDMAQPSTCDRPVALSFNAGAAQASG